MVLCVYPCTLCSREEKYIRNTIGSPLLSFNLMPQHTVVLCEENFHGIANMSFKISLARPALVFLENALYMQGIQDLVEVCRVI
ncbi:hypothetical protein V6N11_012923 [Hibiscus sabdariffa]|uniref:Uncharacterized protein n=2 Tax=Hibiscus sabdariffa TaxID=183260 RepID=A0ABR2N986_9ROSI